MGKYIRDLHSHVSEAPGDGKGHLNVCAPHGLPLLVSLEVTS